MSKMLSMKEIDELPLSQQHAALQVRIDYHNRMIDFGFKGAAVSFAISIAALIFSLLQKAGMSPGDIGGIFSILLLIACIVYYFVDSAKRHDCHIHKGKS